MRYVSCRDVEGHVASDFYCSDQPKPASVEVCIMKNCGIWRTGEWSSCSRSCGKGIASRLVACVSLEDLEHQRDKPVHCEISQRPSHEKMCNHGDCIPQKHFDIASISTNRVEHTAHWRVGPWGAVSKHLISMW
ncbi:hypothetical protein LSH36_660g05024 [Paralvinella palmiformis]|uniref:Uncharacterized protein n=1 Tax=Paralvinella palmiformis TaxID=53620 RepID=A0AAD9MVV2_9ANNE|nr:hypothetical protein LSH36_660g05024 [Paralvinella palmiformis]